MTRFGELFPQFLGRTGEVREVAGQFLHHMRIGIGRRVLKGFKREQPFAYHAAPMLGEELVVVSSDLCREAEVGVERAGREAVRRSQGFE